MINRIYIYSIILILTLVSFGYAAMDTTFSISTPGSSGAGWFKEARFGNPTTGYSFVSSDGKWYSWPTTIPVIPAYMINTSGLSFENANTLNGYVSSTNTTGSPVIVRTMPNGKIPSNMIDTTLLSSASDSTKYLRLGGTGPNLMAGYSGASTLIPTDSSGKLPASVIPSGIPFTASSFDTATITRLITGVKGNYIISNYSIYSTGLNQILKVVGNITTDLSNSSLYTLTTSNWTYPGTWIYIGSTTKIYSINYSVASTGENSGSGRTVTFSRLSSGQWVTITIAWDSTKHEHMSNLIWDISGSIGFETSANLYSGWTASCLTTGAPAYFWVRATTAGFTGYYQYQPYFDNIWAYGWNSTGQVIQYPSIDMSSGSFNTLAVSGYMEGTAREALHASIADIALTALDTTSTINVSIEYQIKLGGLTFAYGTVTGTLTVNALNIGSGANISRWTGDGSVYWNRASYQYAKGILYPESTSYTISTSATGKVYMYVTSFGGKTVNWEYTNSTCAYASVALTAQDLIAGLYEDISTRFSWTCQTAFQVADNSVGTDAIQDGAVNPTKLDRVYLSSSGEYSGVTSGYALDGDWHYSNVVVVAKSGGDYDDISTAISSITNASDTNRYIIIIYPGEYKINSTITAKEYISIKGVDKYTTKLIQNWYWPPGELILAKSHSRYSNLYIKTMESPVIPIRIGNLDPIENISDLEINNCIFESNLQDGLEGIICIWQSNNIKINNVDFYGYGNCSSAISFDHSSSIYITNSIITGVNEAFHYNEQDTNYIYINNCLWNGYSIFSTRIKATGLEIYGNATISCKTYTQSTGADNSGALGGIAADQYARNTGSYSGFTAGESLHTINAETATRANYAPTTGISTTAYSSNTTNGIKFVEDYDTDMDYMPDFSGSYYGQIMLWHDLTNNHGHLMMWVKENDNDKWIDIISLWVWESGA